MMNCTNALSLDNCTVCNVLEQMSPGVAFRHCLPQDINFVFSNITITTMLYTMMIYQYTYIFRRLKFLFQVDLKQNEIKTICTELWRIFSNLNTLVLLDLSNNNLTDVDVNILNIFHKGYGKHIYS